MDQQHVWGVRYIDELVCRDDGTPERLYPTQDANFNVTSLLDSTGDLKQYFVYDPYGISYVYNGAWTVTVDAYAWSRRFAGQQWDFETQINCFRSRYVHSILGSFLTRDPIGYTDSYNLYNYVRDNPTCFVDPTGTRWQNLGNGMSIWIPEYPAKTPQPPTNQCGMVTCDCPCKPINVNVYGESSLADLLNAVCVTLPDGIHCSISCRDILNTDAHAQSGIVPVENTRRPPELDHECCHVCKLFGEPPILNFLDYMGSAIMDDCSKNPIKSHPNW